MSTSKSELGRGEVFTGVLQYGYYQNVTISN